MFEDFFDKFEPGELFVLGGICVFLVFIVECFFEYFFERHIDKRLKVLERIILDESFIIPTYGDRLEGYFKFTPEGDVIKVNDIDISSTGVDINKPTE